MKRTSDARWNADADLGEPVRSKKPGTISDELDENAFIKSLSFPVTQNTQATHRALTAASGRRSLVTVP